MKKIENWIDDALKAEMDFKLNKDFKNKVSHAIKRKELRAQRSIYLFITLGVILMISTGYAYLLHFFPDLIEKMSQEEVNKLVPVVVIAGISVVLIQYLDKKLIKERLIIN